MKQQPKQKKNKEKGIYIYSLQFFLTYSRYNLTKEASLEYLEKIVNKKTEKQKYFISNYIIVNENHKDESLHKYLEDETIYHPNIQGVRSTKAIIIEKEIKEGRYITNNKFAKEYPKTYTLYNKQLIDWKTKIEEQYYKSLGKPFVEFHYRDKICGKSSYAENFDERLHIDLITKIGLMVMINNQF
ncbi:hypothetical protein C2G38_2219172 [Gigaspora rosea]|uniref:Geminivirus AL1 replication-associated protein catalytic domain-containing protein n=1 Tax=Gigaspora rosea TaxID=44941 RepID=A0A397U975_9GLOM|nr:hypothetical protein C2G38_2219172 [Gigaspora rosea]